MRLSIHPWKLATVEDLPEIKDHKAHRAVMSLDRMQVAHLWMEISHSTKNWTRHPDRIKIKFAIGCGMANWIASAIMTGSGIVYLHGLVNKARIPRASFVGRTQQVRPTLVAARAAIGNNDSDRDLLMRSRLR